MYNDDQTTTNSIESINKKLKKDAGTGWITLNAALKCLRKFKMRYRMDYKLKVKGTEGLNKRRITAVEREQLIKISLGRYNLKSEEKQLEEVIDLCLKFGALNEKNVVGQFEKQFESEIAELDEDDELVFEEDELM